jgi:hypothetical protein
VTDEFEAPFDFIATPTLQSGCVHVTFIVDVVGQDYGLFLADEDPRKGVWLENGRTLEYYLLKPGVTMNRLFLC